MSFARIKYKDERGVGWLNSIFKPFYVEKMTDYEDGFDVTINLSEDCSDKWRKRALKGVKKFLDSNCVYAVLGEEIDGVYKADGKMLMVLDSADAVNVSDEIVIIDGDKNFTETLLCVICPHVNYISVISDNNYIYRDTAEFFFREYGINIQLINSFRHENFRNADVIINCALCDESYDHLLKKGCVYYDIQNDDKRLSHIRRIRGDVTVVNSAKHKDKLDLAEVILYSSSSEYRRLVSGNTNCREKLELIANIKMPKLTSIKR